MRAKGITYDTGFTPGGKSSRPHFDTDQVKRELRIIADDLHCDAVRITGGDPERLTVAARYAADAGLETWFSPFPCELTAAHLAPYFADCAARAEAVGAAVFVTGCELSLFATGLLPGADSLARVKTFTSGDPVTAAELDELSTRLDTLLADTAATVRQRFSGKLTYASGLWENIDWTPFDIVGVDAYVDPADPAFQPGLQSYLRHGKPVAATEFGCCTYRGAAARSGLGWTILEDDTDPPRLNGDYLRDEDEQATYLREVFEAFDSASVDTAFWFTFAGYTYPHHTDPRLDLDMASYGVCKVMPDGTLTPKRSFHTLAQIR